MSIDERNFLNFTKLEERFLGAREQGCIKTLSIGERSILAI